MSKKRQLGPLDEKRFWDLIACTAKPAVGEQDEARRTQLERLPPDDILGFKLRFNDLINRAYGVDLWGAAYLINGGCSDDGFYDFRVWVIARGKEVYESALADPDSLAGVVRTGDVGSALNEMAFDAWVAVTGRTDEEFCKEMRAGGPHWKDPHWDPKYEEAGWDFDDDEEMRRRFPRLARRFLDREEGA
jgi:hypothetical protein